MTEYFVDGLLHCEDGPAVIIDPFIKKWYKHGMRHREDGPAIECGSYKEWWLEDRLHNIDNPAVIGAYSREWWLFGSRHRLDGAAVERDMNVYKNPNYKQEWWLFGKEYREKEMFIQDLKKLKESILNKLIDAGVCKDLSTVIISYYTQN
jgi:hypothetical protein